MLFCSYRIRLYIIHCTIQCSTKKKALVRKAMQFIPWTAFVRWFWRLIIFVSFDVINPLKLALSQNTTEVRIFVHGCEAYRHQHKHDCIKNITQCSTFQRNLKRLAVRMAIKKLYENFGTKHFLKDLVLQKHLHWLACWSECARTLAVVDGTNDDMPLDECNTICYHLISKYVLPYS